MGRGRRRAHRFPVCEPRDLMRPAQFSPNGAAEAQGEKAITRMTRGVAPDAAFLDEIRACERKVLLLRD